MDSRERAREWLYGDRDDIGTVVDSLSREFDAHAAERVREALERAVDVGFAAINAMVNDTPDTPTGGEASTWLQRAAVAADNAIRALLKEMSNG